MESTILHKDSDTEKVFANSPSTEALGGISAVVLAALGLANISPALMASIAIIALGAALLFESGTVAAEYAKIMRETGNGRLQFIELGGGLGTGVLTGGAAAVLGTITLLQIGPHKLLPIATVVIGLGVITGSRLVSRLNMVKIETSGDREPAKRAAHEVVLSATGAQVVAGLAALALGILGLIGIDSMTMTLVALLVVGVSVLLNGTAVTGRMVTLFGG